MSDVVPSPQPEPPARRAVDPATLRAAVQAAIEAAGGKTKLARGLGLTRAAPQHWSRVPDRHVRAVARLTGLPLHRLRPDLYGGITDQSD